MLKCLMSDMVVTVSAVGVCALGETMLRLLCYSFVVISEKLFQQNIDLKFPATYLWVHTDVASSPIDHHRHPRVWVALICCRKLTRWHAHWKTC
jgi:hypothetical protein